MCFFQAISRLCEDKYKDLSKAAVRRSISMDNLVGAKKSQAVLSWVWWRLEAAELDVDAEQRAQSQAKSLTETFHRGILWLVLWEEQTTARMARLPYSTSKINPTYSVCVELCLSSICWKIVLTFGFGQRVTCWKERTDLIFLFLSTVSRSLSGSLLLWPRPATPFVRTPTDLFWTTLWCSSAQTH